MLLKSSYFYFLLSKKMESQADMNGKDTFVCRKKYLNQISKLSTEQKADLLQCMFEYQNTQHYETTDLAIDMLLSVMVDERKSDDEKWTKTKNERSEAWKKHEWNQYTKGDAKWKVQKKAVEQMEQNGTSGTNGTVYVSVSDNVNVSVYDSVYKSYYWFNKWIDEKKCDKLINDKLKQWITLEDIKIWIVLYNTECRVKQEYRYVKKFETWIKEFQKLNEDQINETLRIIIKQHKQKINTDEKYSKSDVAKTVYTDLCETFGKERINEIYKAENRNTIQLHFT